jgi:DNA repair photolyase
VITKSDLVARDLDLLAKMHCVVSFTITTLDRALSRKLEPRAPLPKLRLKAMKRIFRAGVPVSLRLDPIIPFLNDGEIDELVETAARHGAKHVTCSTFKPRPDSWRRMKLVFPKLAVKLTPLYFGRGVRHHNAWYLPQELRLRLLGKAKRACEQNGLTFATCREGLSELITAPSCDGGHLIRT